MPPTIHYIEETGEAYYYHPYTRAKIWLEPEDDATEIVEGWEDHLADMADDAWHDREV